MYKNKKCWFFNTSNLLANETSGIRTPDNLIKSQDAFPLFPVLWDTFVDILRTLFFLISEIKFVFFPYYIANITPYRAIFYKYTSSIDGKLFPYSIMNSNLFCHVNIVQRIFSIRPAWILARIPNITNHAHFI